MNFILTIVLASGLSGPVEMPEDICKATAEMVQSGSPVFVELESGSVELVVEATCEQKGVGA